MTLLLVGLAYVTWHVWAVLPIPGLWRVIVIGLLVICFLMFFLDIGGQLDSLPLPLARGCYAIGTTSVMVFLYLLMAFLVLDLGRLVHIAPRSWFFGNWVTVAAITGLLATIFVCGNLNYYHKVRVPLLLESKKLLPKEYRIVMLSDLHLGYHNSRSDLAHWVDLINREQPDLILIAGDIIDISVRPLLEEKMAEEFHRLKAPVYACLGNHEYYSGKPKVQQFYRDANIHLLNDSTTEIDNAIVIIGRDDRTNRHRKELHELASLADKSKYTILLDHQPYDLNQAEEAGVDFQLSGHTHRGQVWPISWITDAVYERSWGHHQRGNTQYYVSSGLGIWGGKFRIGTQSEYVVATLHSSH